MDKFPRGDGSGGSNALVWRLIFSCEGKGRIAEKAEAMDTEMLTS